MSHSALRPQEAAVIESDVARALAEDLGSGDLTASLLPDAPLRAQLICREQAILAGAPWFEACLRALDAKVRCIWRLADGAALQPGVTVCVIEGHGRALLSAERCAINFLQTLSGTATATARHVAAVAGTRTRILDTRKTLPGLRLAQKYAVRCGGALNHRMGLYDMVLIKENHILAAGSIAAAVDAARAIASGTRIEVEVESLAEFEQALDAGADLVLLDDFSLEDMATAVARNRARGRLARLEASGSVTLESVRAIAATGVDFVSVGALTKHVRAVDLSLRLTL
ncbi:carboxylating nicotinate-nucleotide diphosphorylase [Metallibacterium sp.]|uniref:carboxylating nicotinate-nucleotide diphosphorylase n=1 Tax=Metallibacterium sp. TaxID=2940281 RepID=UPI00262DCB44|nr:carboxylating nicotinate-nucleotide diphosphorylase [Metallibacterium sp.]